MKKFYSVEGNMLLSLAIFIFCLSFPGKLSAQVYANSQTNGVTGLCLLCGVANPDNAVNTDLTDYSTFNITAGLLGTTVQQTLIFPAISSTGCDSLVIRVGSDNAVLSVNLFGGVTVQTFNGSTANNDAHVVDSASLRLLQNNTQAFVVLHPTQSFDRVKITLNSSLLGLLSGFRVYYAYHNSGKPSNPVFAVPQGNTCGTQLLPIVNHRQGTNYNVRLKYTNVLSQVLLDTSFSIINNDTVHVPGIVSPLSVQVNVYLQAVNPFTGCVSDTVLMAFIAGGSGGLPQVDADSITICKGNSATLHAFIPGNTLPTMRWYSAPSGGNLLYSGNYFTVSPDSTTTYYVTALLVCEYPGRRPVNVKVTKLPDPVYQVPQGFVCGNAYLPVQNHVNGINYYVRIKYVPNVGLPSSDTSFTVINKDTIIVPGKSLFAVTTTEVYVQAFDPLSGCRSDSVHQTLTLGPTGPVPNVDADSLNICDTDSVTLHAYTPGADFPQIRWYDAPTGGNLLHVGNYYTVKPATTMTYYVTSAISCENPVRRSVIVIVRHCLNTSTSPHIAASKTPAPAVTTLAFYPNPTHGEVRFTADKDLTGSILSIKDVSGREVQREQLKSNGFRIINQTLKGIYIVEVVTKERQVYIGKIVLQ
ncbi:Ig-like domain-containing protein [Chitinophaga vietnamensis]|uniref:Ig-like domain-containing protein n=1 Tax=Chitinophaga vietnamensis TaxID=2593957 RepID=UPI00137628D3|nr:T9SS type A sorting domain-containing protein [Chitinophaga vietnamensis]